MNTPLSTEARELVQVEHALCPECGSVIEDHFSADLQIEKQRNQKLERELAAAVRTISRFERGGVKTGLVEDIFQLWFNLNGKDARTQLTPDRRKAITAALKLRGEARVRKVVSQNAKTPYLVYTAWRPTGQAESKRDIADVLSKGKHFEALEALADEAPVIDWTEERLAEAQALLLSTEAVVGRLTEGKGWTAETLETLGVGLAEGRLIFPVRDEDGTLTAVTKYHPRLRGGDKNLVKSYADGKRGMFPAPESVDSDVIWLVEGEADAVTAHEMWLPGVALPGASVTPGEWMQRLKGRKVVICLDCDDAGRKCANRIARPLTQYAAEVKVVDLNPARHDGFDLTDWFNQGRQRKTLEEMARVAKPVSSVHTPSLLPQQTLGGSEPTAKRTVSKTVNPGSNPGSRAASPDTRFDRFVRALEARDCNPQEMRGGQWRSLCPAHDDRVPTLYFRRGDDAPAVTDCKAGCSWNEISEALGHPTRGKD